MAYDPNIRASDADRDRAAALLREHLAAGRLNAEEFSERLDKAFTAKTLGEVDGLLRDLPGIDLYRLPDAALTRQPRQSQARSSRPRSHGDGWRTAWISWFTVTLLCVVVWALGGFGYPWPLWVALPWGVVMLGGWLSSSHGAAGRRRLGGSGEHDRGQLPRGDEDLPGRPGS